MSLDRNHFKKAKVIAVMLVLIFTVSVLASTVAAHSEPATLFLRAKATEDVKIKLDWEITNETGVVKYNIYWQEEEFDGVPTGEPDATTTEMKYTVKDLKGANLYYFLVSAVDSSGTSLAYGEDSNTPGEWADAGVLKEVDFWRVMTFTGIILVIFIYVLMNVPKWVKEEEAAGGA